MEGRREIRVDQLSEPFSHYTDAVRYRDLLFISGCVPLDSHGNLVGTEAAPQARQVLENMRRILQSVGSGFQDVLKVTVYLTDIDDREKINAVRKEFFGETRPASTLVEVSRLVIADIRVEMDAIASVTDQQVEHD